MSDFEWFDIMIQMYNREITMNKTVPNFCGQPTMMNIIIIIIYYEEFSINYYARRAISQW